MPDVTKLSLSSFDVLYAGLRGEMVAVSDELISTGLGMVPGEEIQKLAENGDPLAIRYVQVRDAFEEAAYERSARFHASTERRLADPSSAPAGPRKRMVQRQLTAAILLPEPQALLPG